jgi:iron-sulfur cluster repair protein YtfE (RIC family)
LETVMEDLTIDRTWSVNDVLQHYPAAASVFSALGLDTCCSGPLTLAEAAQRKRVDINVLLEVLHRAGAHD